MLDRLADRDREIQRLEKDVEEAKAERRRLLDFISLRSNGMTIYAPPSVPSFDESRDEVSAPSPQEVQNNTADFVSKARVRVRRDEARNMLEFTAEQRKVQTELQAIIDQGRNQASVAVEGNGTHGD